MRLSLPIGILLLCAMYGVATAQTFTLTTTPRTQTVQPYQAATFRIDVVPADGYMATVNMNVVPDFTGAFYPAPSKLNYPYTGGATFSVTLANSLAGTHQIIVHGWNGSLHAFDTVYVTIPETRDMKGWVRFNTSNSPLPDTIITALALDRDDNGWVGTIGGYVAKFDRRNWNVYSFTAAKDTIRKWDSITGKDTIIITGTSRISLPIRALAPDTNNDIWMGWDVGVQKFNGTWNKITSTGNELSGPVTSIAVAPDQTIWFNLQSKGVARFNSSGWSQFTQSNSPLLIPAPQKLAAGSNGRLFVIGNPDYRSGLSMALSVYDGTFWSIYSITDLGIAPYGEGVAGIGAITVDAHGDMWLACSASLIRYHNGELTKFKFPYLLAAIRDLTFDAEGNAWIATTAGLVRYDFSTLTTWTADNSGIPHNHVNGVRVDRDGVVWVATEGGLALFDREHVLSVPHQSAGSSTSALQASLAPNPVIGSTTLHLHISDNNPIHISLVDGLGRTVRTVFTRTPGSGDHTLPLDVTDIPTGAYHVQIRNGTYVQTLPIMVVR